jgi:hypothetical protein
VIDRRTRRPVSRSSREDNASKQRIQDVKKHIREMVMDRMGWDERNRGLARKREATMVKQKATQTKNAAGKN